MKCRLGSYYLLDTSTNGVFVNGGTVPIGRRSIYPLRDGDRLRLGDYQVAVSIDSGRRTGARGERDISGRPAGHRLRDSTAGTRYRRCTSIYRICCAAPSRRRVARGAARSKTRAAGLRSRWALVLPAQATRTRDELRASPAHSRRATHRRRRQRSSRTASPETPRVEAFCRGAGIDAKALAPKRRRGCCIWPG